MNVPSHETSSEITSAAEAVAQPLALDEVAPKASVESLETKVVSEPDATPVHVAIEKNVPRVTAQQAATESSELNHQVLESLERLPVESISLENSEVSTLQESNDDQWLLPAVVKLKN